jgi:hypothetical protein
MIEVVPGNKASLPMSDSVSMEMDVRKIQSLLMNFIPLYRKVEVFNKTKTCKVQIAFQEGIILIEVTNYEEDEKFRFDRPQENPSPAETETERITPMPPE